MDHVQVKCCLEHVLALVTSFLVFNNICLFHTAHQHKASLPSTEFAATWKDAD